MQIRWRGLELPTRACLDAGTASSTYGLFVVEPFERGFGITVGNSLRRVLLSSIEGSAVTWLKIDGVANEFSSIPGVVEDVTDIILNVKSIVVRSHVDQPKIMKLSGNKKGPLTAGMIDADPALEIFDPDVSIAGVVAGPSGAPNANMKIVAKDVPLDERLKAILPEGMQAAWEPVNPEGKVDIYINSLNFSLSESGGKIWDLSGAGLLKDVNLANPFPCRGLSANITGNLQTSKKGTQIICQGPLTIPELQVGPLRITDVTGLFSKESAADPRWSVKNIKGKLAGGTVLAQINGKFETDGAFAATIEAEEVDLATLMNEFAASRKEKDDSSQPEEAQAQGILKASVKLDGKLSAAETPTGRGKVLIEKAQLYRLPLIIQIMRVLSLQPIHTNAFDTASFDFYLEGQKIIFTEIALTGPALRMVGTGVYDRSDDTIHAVLVNDPPKDFWRILPTLPQMVVAEIGGTMAEPKVQDKPFRDISEELKSLFQARKPREY